MGKRFTWQGIICLGIFIYVLCMVPVSTQAATIADFRVPADFRFTRDIQFGSTTRPDVSYLQNILNMSTSTRVATTGAGSLKKPSNYYGDKTRDAVYRFQTIFAIDIDYERSISTSTATSTVVMSSSTLDVFTRAVLNKLIIIYSGDRDRYLEYVRTGTTTPTTEETVSEDLATEESGTSNTSGTTGTSQSGSGGGSNNPLGQIQMPHEFIYQGKKLMFTYSPEGQILKAIGGQQLVDQVFSYTPAGMVGQLTGMSGSGSGSGIGAAGGMMGGGSSGESTTGTTLMNFGGESTSMTTCTCSDNFLIYVQDVRGYTLPLMYQPGVTVLYKMYRPTSGVNMLGQYVSGGECLIYSGYTCTTGGSPVGTMTQLGTSLTIGKTSE